MQSQTKTSPALQKTESAKCEVTSLRVCFTSPRQRSCHCLRHLPPPPLPAGERWASANGFARPSPERIHAASSGSGRPLSSPSPLPFADHCVSWSCIRVYTRRPDRCSPNAPARLRCTTPVGPRPGRISGRKQKIS